MYNFEKIKFVFENARDKVTLFINLFIFINTKIFLIYKKYFFWVKINNFYVFNFKKYISLITIIVVYLCKKCKLCLYINVIHI